MGERGADHREAPTEGELAAMARRGRRGARRRARSGSPRRGPRCTRPAPANRSPTLTASEAELLAIADAMRSAGAGVVQLISDLYQSPDDDFAHGELDLLQRFVETSGRPLSFTMQQAYHSPERWRFQMDWVDRMVAAGHDVKAQVASRPIGVLHRPHGDGQPVPVLRVATTRCRGSTSPIGSTALRDPERKRRILAEHAEIAAGLSPGLLPTDHGAGSTSCSA